MHHPAVRLSVLVAVRRAKLLGRRPRLDHAFRPIKAQWALWMALPDPCFVSDPRTAGTLPRGGAIDVALEDAHGRVLPMGTGFNDMTAAASHEAADLPAEAIRNRVLLLGVMVVSGWES